MPYNYDTPEGNFKIHYDVTGYHGVDSVGYVHKIGEYCERVWALYIDTIGYLPPPPDDGLGGDDRYDIYLRNIGSYGLTWPGTDGPQPWNDLSSYIEIENDFSGAYPNDDPEGPVAGAMKVTCAHEFHHAVQFGLRGSSTVWLAELTSVAFEERVYPYVNDYVWLIDYFMEDPHLPMTWTVGYHMYGLGILGQFWNMSYGDDFVFSIWDTMRFIPDMEAIWGVSGEYGTNIGDELAAFGTMALLSGTRDYGFFPDGPALTDLSVERTHNSYPTGGSPSNRPYGYGMNCIIFSGLDMEPCDLEIQFDGDSAADWHILVVWVTADSLGFYTFEIDSTGDGDVRIAFADEADFIGMTVVPIADSSVQYNYSYTADKTTVSIDESPKPLSVKLNVFPNPFNSSCSIEIPGWIREDTHLTIHDYNGRLVRELPVVVGNGDPTNVIWDGLDKRGMELPSGIYLVHLPFDKVSSKIVLLR